MRLIPIITEIIAEINRIEIKAIMHITEGIVTVIKATNRTDEIVKAILATIPIEEIVRVIKTTIRLGEATEL